MALDYTEYNAYDVEQQIQADPVTRRQLTAIAQGPADEKLSVWYGWAIVQLVIGIFVVVEVITSTHAFTGGSWISGGDILAFLVSALVAAMVTMTLYIAGRQGRDAAAPPERTSNDTLIGIYIASMRASSLNPDFLHSIDNNNGSRSNGGGQDFG